MRFLRRLGNRLTRYCCETCKRCGRRVAIVWTANDGLYALLTGITDGSGVFCPRCFSRFGEAQGYMLRWVPVIAYDREQGSLESIYAGKLYPVRADEMVSSNSSSVKPPEDSAT